MSGLDGFTALTITPDVEQAPWDDLDKTEANRPDRNGVLERVGLLRNGMTSGRASVGLVIRLDTGEHVVAQTSFALWRAAVRALEATPIAAEEPLDD